ncbi:unknown [Firmicutes bacterium CAG:582]|nr:unknown [Firmicutes bacterium CAG:582]
MNNGKGNMILLTVIAVATLLVAVVGATFAYFGATINNESETPIEVTSGTLSVEYDGDSKINLQSLMSNTETVVATKTFNITGVVTGSNNLNYESSLVVTNNTFGDGELKYTITSTNVTDNGTTFTSTTEPVAIPTGTNTIILGKGLFAGPIVTGATHTYTINIITNSIDATNKVFESHLSTSQTKN